MSYSWNELFMKSRVFMKSRYFYWISSFSLKLDVFMESRFLTRSSQEIFACATCVIWTQALNTYVYFLCAYTCIQLQRYFQSAFVCLHVFDCVHVFVQCIKYMHPNTCIQIHGSKCMYASNANLVAENAPWMRSVGWDATRRALR